MSSGYDFVPLPSDPRRAKQPIGSLSGTLAYSLRTLEPVHIGTGGKRIRNNQIVRDLARSGGQPIIPGSTFKGLLRARFEAITKSCLLLHPKPSGGGVSSRSRPDVKSARFIDAAARVLEVLRPCGASLPCPACGLFGCMSLRSRVDVGDIAPRLTVTTIVHPVPQQFSPRLHHIGRAEVHERSTPLAFHVSTFHGRKFARPPGLRDENTQHQHVEAIPAEVELHGVIGFRYLHREELGGLLAALGYLPRSLLRLGGGKCYGLGLVDLRSLELTLRPPEPVSTLIETCHQAFLRELAIPTNLDKLNKIHSSR